MEGIDYSVLLWKLQAGAAGTILIALELNKSWPLRGHREKRLSIK